MIITPDTTLRGILRLRPRSVAIFERESAFRFWNHLDESLGAFCRLLALDQDSLAHRLESLPAVPPDTDWAAKPVYHLIDYLTRNHEDFRDMDMKGIEALLSRERLPGYPDGYVEKLMLQEFRHFEQGFLKHMEEEEVFLFPKIIRNEACFRHPALDPEAYKGSVNLYLKLESHKPEDVFKRMLASIREKLRNQLMHQPAVDLVRETLVALESFEGRLLAHADLEADVLFPRAGRLEQELYEGSVPGLSRYPGD